MVSRYDTRVPTTASTLKSSAYGVARLPGAAHHTGDDQLSGFWIDPTLEGWVFAFQSRQSFGQFFFVGVRFWFDRHRDHWQSKADTFKDRLIVFAAEGFTSRGKFQTNDRTNVTGPISSIGVWFIACS